MDDALVTVFEAFAQLAPEDQQELLALANSLASKQ